MHGLVFPPNGLQVGQLTINKFIGMTVCMPVGTAGNGGK